MRAISLLFSAVPGHMCAFPRTLSYRLVWNKTINSLLSSSPIRIRPIRHLRRIPLMSSSLFIDNPLFHK
ncbi:MAG TPA: hypothetical protein ACN46M_09290 [Prochlorococcus sp.]